MQRSRSLKKGTEFDRVYSEGTVTSGPLFVVRALPNPAELTRWGFAVGKKLSGSAVVRNRLKRQMREAARDVNPDRGIDIVVTARPGTLRATFSELDRELKATVARAVRRSARL